MGRIVGYHKRRDEGAVRTWRVLTGWVAVFVLAIALIVPFPVMPAGAMPHEDASPISVSFAASEQGPAGLSSHALVCHMHFEHHQSLRSENALAIPAPDSSHAFYLAHVNPLASLEPYLLLRPPRA